MEYTLATPMLGRPVCLVCEPETDVTAEIIDSRPCRAHQMPARTEADERVPALAELAGMTEAGGEDNRRWCAVLHRGGT
jgi:hypothetical protein